VFSLLVVLISLSVPVQVFDWKDLSLKWPVMCSWWMLNPTHLVDLAIAKHLRVRHYV